MENHYKEPVSQKVTHIRHVRNTPHWHFFIWCGFLHGTLRTVYARKIFSANERVNTHFPLDKFIRKNRFFFKICFILFAIPY